MSILGNWVPRVEDPRLLTVGGTYVDDVRLAGALHAHFVRSPLAHGEIRGIETAAAQKAPGVVAVLTAQDLGLEPLPVMGPPQMARPPLASGRVRFVGEPLAVVVAETRAQAVDAAELVEVDLEPLPALVDPTEARDGTVLLFPEAGTNVCGQVAPGPDDEDDLFAGCDVVVRQRMVNQRLAPCPLEVRGAAAVVGEDGRLTLWITSQHPHADRDAVAGALHLDPAQVRVVAPDVGGAFGSKMAAYPEQIVVAALARHLGRPVRWTETRSESMVNLGHGRAQIQEVAIGGTRDGRILAFSLEVLQDTGAYPALGAFLPNLTRMMATGVYDIPKVRFSATSVVTTTTPVVAYRGAGRPEATAAIERAVDLFARELGLDPAEVRRQNFVAPDRFPYTTRVGTTYDSGNYPAALDRLLSALDYAGVRAEQERRRAEGSRWLLGIGLSAYVEVTGAVPGAELGAVEIRSDGTAVVRAGTFSHGQGHATAFAMLVADRLGIPLERIEFRQGDTDEVPRGMGTYGSRSLQSGGVAVVQAAEAVLDEARRLAAERLEANPQDIVVDREGRGLHVAGAPARTVSWGEIVAGAGGRLVKEVDFAPPGPTFPFGAHAAVVEVDRETGAVRVVRMVAVDDAGTLLNPLLAAGQIHGGLAQGVAQALLEEFVYDDQGNPLTANLADYPMVSATELPSFERLVMETPTPLNELGAKGIGESGTIGSTPAVQNAVCDALAHLGVRHLDMPARPERVWRALVEAQRTST